MNEKSDFFFLTLVTGRALAQGVSSWPLTAEARVRGRVSSCGICGGQKVAVGRFFSEFFDFKRAIHHSTIAHLSPPHEVCNSPDQAAHYHTWVWVVCVLLWFIMIIWF
jgi:hypothetical protein